MQDIPITADPARRLVAPLRALLAVCFVLPVLVTAYLAFSTYRGLSRDVDERVARTLDVLQEHALKVLHTTDRLLVEADAAIPEVIAGDAASESAAHRKLAELQRVLPEVQAIWLFAPDGRALASSTLYPVPPLDNSDRDYFRAQREADAGFFIGSNVRAKVGGLTFFVVSRRRTGGSREGFGGVVALTLPPAAFQDFYGKVVRNIDMSAGLFRADGFPLARYPEPSGGMAAARTTAAFLEKLRTAPDVGSYTVASGLDGVLRRIVYRRVAPYQVYVTAGYESAAFWREWRARVLDQAWLGLPLACLLVAMSWFALRRSRELIREFELRRRAEEALTHAQRLEALGQLTGGVAHDFNNLLMVVQGSADRIGRDPLTPRQEKMLAALRECARRGESLTRQLLTYSRRSPVTPKVVRLQDRAEPLRHMLRTSLRGDIRLEIEIEPDLRPVFCDEAEFDLAMLNLALNARDAMPNGGTFRIVARNAPAELSGIVIEVSDTGSGIPAENLGKIFDPFFTTKDVGQGTGLGLSQVYGFATRAGGRVTVGSVVGQGTRFTLTFPPVGPTQLSVADVPVAPDPPARRMRVLLVEDNDEVAEVTRANLEADGHEVVRAANVAGALAVLEGDARFDLMFSDIVMPGGRSGLDLAREVGRRWPRLAIILTTGYNAAGSDDDTAPYPLLRKPFTASGLRDALRKADAAREGRGRAA